MLYSKKIIADIEKGDVSAAETVVLEYYDEIYKFICRRVGSPTDAQDLTQEVFLKFVASLQGYRECGRVKSFLFKIAVNTVNDFFRKKCRVVFVDVTEELPDDSPSPLTDISFKDEARLANEALKSLPSFQAEVIILRIYHNLSFKEIAKVTDCTVPTAKSRYRQGLEKLKKRMEATCRDE